MEPVELFGAPVGLYTGKIRCYLRKQGIPFVEKLPTDRGFTKTVLPAIQRFMNPVLRLADGTIVQDTSDIIAFCEARGLARRPAIPSSPKQKLVALALDLYGGEGLSRAAMHYRWSFLDDNESFLRHEFGLPYRAIGMNDDDAAQRLDAFMGYLQQHLPSLGIDAASAPSIEEAYEDLLARLDAHFRTQPYALGGQPTCADYGLVATLWAHLGRDPYPSMQMKKTAPGVYRWVERMNACDDDVPEFPRTPRTLPADDAIAPTLLAVLEAMARDYLPELRALVAAADAHLAARPGITAGTPCTDAPPIRWFCEIAFELRGRRLRSQAQPYTLWMLQRVTDAFRALADDDREAVRALFAEAGLEELLELRASRRVERSHYLEVWGELQR